MYKNNNKKHLLNFNLEKKAFFKKSFTEIILGFLWIFIVNNENKLTKKSNHLMNERLSFSTEENFFKSLTEACSRNNINVAICTNNKKNISCNFNNIPLGQILDISLDGFSVEQIGNFIVVKDKQPLTKIYTVNKNLSENQLKNIFKFLEEFTKNTSSQFSFNRDDGTIVFTSLPVYHEHLRDYINNINYHYDQQILLECKIIFIQNNKHNNKNLNIFSFLNHLLKMQLPFSAFNFIGNFYSNLVLFSDLDSVVRFLSHLWEGETTHNIEMLISNGQVCKMKTDECRYSSKYYDMQMVDDNNYTEINNDSPYSIPIIKGKKSIIKNLKKFNGGINLSFTPKMKENYVFLNIDYSQTSFQDECKKNELPITINNSLTTAIKIKYGQPVVINGLKTKIKKKVKKNTTRFWLWNFLFSQEEEVELECQILFLIKVEKA
jgi:hypothetical protein